MSAVARQTITYHDIPRDDAAADRVKIILVGGIRPVATNDFQNLLRRRLLVLSAFLAATFLVWTLFSFAFGPDPNLLQIRTYRDLMVHHLKSALLIAVNLASAFFLWRQPSLSLLALRVIEVAVVGSLVAVILSVGVDALAYQFLMAVPTEPAYVGQALIGRYVNAGGLLWFFVLTAYGTLIPNSLKRAAIILGLIAISPLALFVIYAVWIQPLDPMITATVVSTLAISNSVAVALALFATVRIETLTKQVSDARRLGQYVLKEKLGDGGMGEVYRAEHALLRRPCALKIIRPERAGDPETLRRFEREVQSTASLTHPNTIHVFDYGHTVDGTFYYVMEYLPGLTLEELVRQHGPLPPRRAVYLLRQVCAALKEAHSLGLTHRDIKPGNVMICERGGTYDVVKVLDFGLVRSPREDGDGIVTFKETMLGTPAYLSPEQAGGEANIDPRSDLYSLGAVAYFLLTGQPPFADRSIVKMLAAHLYEMPEALPSNIPPDLSRVILRCLAKDPAERWPDTASLETALADLAIPPWTTDEATAWWSAIGARKMDASP